MSKKGDNKNQVRAKSTVRIVAGRWRGRKINFPANHLGLRPTPDRVRETLFNWLAPIIGNAVCLDLFAGSGALAFEALSRGAKKVTLVEQNTSVCQSIEQAAEVLGIKVAPEFELIKQDVLSWLLQLKVKAANISKVEPCIDSKFSIKAYDVIFLDPPYGLGNDLLLNCCQQIEQLALLKSGGYIYLEHNQELAVELLPSGWEKFRAGKAGQVYYYLLTRQG